MMTSIEACVRRGRRTLKQWAARPAVSRGLDAAGIFLRGFLLSAGGLAGSAMPLGLGAVLGAS